jgi:hypothetical protein
MGNLEGNFTPVLYIGRKVPKGEVIHPIYVKIYTLETHQHDVIFKATTTFTTPEVQLT